jgi:hypothetical protein
MLISCYALIMRAKETRITGLKLQRLVGSVGGCVNVRSYVSERGPVLKHFEKIFGEIK